MSNYSKNTQLLNCLIGLATISPDFPHPLWEEGFQLEKLEPRILLSDGKYAKPDIQFKKNDNSLLFFECKDGSCEVEQLNRYKQITKEDIIRNKITALTATEINHDLAYFGTYEKEEKLVESIEGYGNTFPIVILEDTKVRKNEKSGEFKNQILNRLFKEIKLVSRIPVDYIPFTVDDDEKIIMIHLLQYLMKMGEDEFDLEDILSELFGHFMDTYSRDGREALKGRINRLINKLSNEAVFSNVLFTKNNKYFIKASPTKFKNACFKLMKKYDEASGIQKTLF